MSIDSVFNELVVDLEKKAHKDILSSAKTVVLNTRKYSGQAKMNTNASLNSIDKTMKWAIPYQRNYFTSATSASINDMTKDLSKFKAGDVVYITNDLHYINHLETVKGDFMFMKAIREINK